LRASVSPCTEDGCFYYVNAETSAVQTNKVFVVNNMGMSKPVMLDSVSNSPFDDAELAKLAAGQMGHNWA